LGYKGIHYKGKERHMETESGTNTRVRMNLSLTAKGMVQFDVTAEYPTAAESEAALGDAIDSIRRVCGAKGLQLVTAA